MPQEQPNPQEMIQKRKDFAPKLMELNEKVQIARHLGASWSLQARSELDYGRDPRRAISHQRITLSHCPRPREWDQQRRTGRSVHPSGFLRRMAERDEGRQYSHGCPGRNGIGCPLTKEFPMVQANFRTTLEKCLVA
jgi:hypothetical protein